jgi:hypothetical protein
MALTRQHINTTSVFKIRPKTYHLAVCFPNFPQWRNPDNNCLYPHKLLPMKKFTGQQTETPGDARRLLQYCQLRDKNSCVISWDIWKSSRYFKTFMFLFRHFSQNPYGVYSCSAMCFLVTSINTEGISNSPI